MHTWAPPLLLRNAVAEVELYRSEAPADGAGDPPAGAAAVRHSLTRPLAEPRWSWAYRREAEHFVASSARHPVPLLRRGHPHRRPYP